MKLYDTGVYLLNGQKIVPENQADFSVYFKLSNSFVSSPSEFVPSRNRISLL